MFHPKQGKKVVGQIIIFLTSLFFKDNTIYLYAKKKNLHQSFQKSTNEEHKEAESFLSASLHNRHHLCMNSSTLTCLLTRAYNTYLSDQSRILNEVVKVQSGPHEFCMTFELLVNGIVRLTI